jgi:zinc protease
MNPMLQTVRTTALLLPALLAGQAMAAPQEPAAEPAASPVIEVVTLESPASPLVAVQLLFKVGSIHDPAGKEGLAALTGAMLAEAGTAKRSYRELVEALYPMAAEIDVQVDREVTVISGQVHRDTLDDFTALLTEALLEPGFAAGDFERNREQLLAYLTNTLRAANDELLGLEAIQGAVFRGHPYEHPPQGTVQGLGRITLDDVRAFFREHYTQAALILGVAGGYPEGYPRRLAQTLARLPEGKPGLMALPRPGQPQGRRFQLIEKKTASVGLHVGYPLPINRTDADYYPLMVANSFLGEHRTQHGRLMRQLRGERGLNYGDYSYIEYWHRPPFTSTPSPGVPRRHQYFSIWLRPVVPDTAHFALRAALYELDRLIEEGLSPEQFELTRTFLRNYSRLWAQTLEDRLGFLLDSRFLGMEPYIDEIDRRLARLTREEVLQALRKHLQSEDFVAVLVTDGGAAVKAYLEADQPSPMRYGSAVSAAVLEADKAIQKLPVRPAAVTITPVAEVFEK